VNSFHRVKIWKEGRFTTCGHYCRR